MSLTNRRAFTLIELLVVIAIIGILAAILFPVFAQAREAARAIGCISNFKQVDTAITMYVQDYDEMFPNISQAGIGSPYFGVYPYDNPWPLQVQPYIKNWTIFRCPDDPNANDSGLSLGATDQQEAPGTSQDKIHWDWAWRVNVGYNADWLAYNTGYCLPGGPFNIATMSKVNRPSSTILFVDSIWNVINGAPEGGGSWVVDAPVGPSDLGCRISSWSLQPNTWNAYGGAWPWHTSRTRFNVAYIDGHAKSRSLDQLMAGADPNKYIIYDNDAYQWSTN